MRYFGFVVQEYAKIRFWRHVTIAPGCWLWIKAKTYANFWDGTKQVPAHRFAYEYLFGPIPDGLEIDHLCRNPPCVNPGHLEPVTRKENVGRGAVVRRELRTTTWGKYKGGGAGGKMANINVSEETRNRLRALKRGGERYDQTLERILDRVQAADLDIEPTPEEDKARPVT